jgi:hypothetical protein
MEIPRDPDPVRGDIVPGGRVSVDRVEVEGSTPLVAPGYSGLSRALFGFVTLAMAFCVVVLVMSGGWMDFLLAAGAALVAGTMGYCAVTGREPASSRQFSFSPRFHELADPARPLTASVPVSGAPADDDLISRPAEGFLDRPSSHVLPIVGDAPSSRS